MTAAALEKLGYATLVAAFSLAAIAILATPGCTSVSRTLACGATALLVYGFGTILNAPAFRRPRSVAVALICLGLCVATAARMLDILSETVVTAAPRCPLSA